MAASNFTVIRQPAVLVAPALPTPHEFLYLSNLDDQSGIRFQVPLVDLYQSNSSKKGQNPAKVIKEALGKLLVPYYPLAGRLRDASNGKLQVECTGEGVLFIEADADVSLDDFGELSPPFPNWKELLYDVPGSSNITDSPVLLIQVTRLRCGGFIFALRLNHSIADGGGISQFMNALGEIARGAAQRSVTPVWDRELLRPRMQHTLKYSPSENNYVVEAKYEQIISVDEMTHKSFFFGPDLISALKAQVTDFECTTFDVLSAYVWRARTKSLDMPAEQVVMFIFLLDAHRRFEPPLPSGYYGNACCFVCARTSAGDLLGKPISFAAKLIHDAKGIPNDKSLRLLIDSIEDRDRPLFSPIGAFVISDVRKTGYDQVDFGWGKPVYGGPAQSGVGVVPGVCSFYVHATNKNGVKGVIFPLCLPEAAMEKFEAEMSKPIQNDIPGQDSS